jgi:two-component system, chemotaxis family, CheB/CheR fusion protein
MPDPTHQLVVIGASAGGVEALTVLIGMLPRDFPARVVVAQHLDPRRPSSLAGILEHRSQLPVRVVESRTEMVPGTVYVVPSNQHVRISDGCVEIEGDHGGRPRPSIDRLLSTAAAAYGEQLIAVVLTGAGSDGAAGAVDVKTAGGTVIIQNPETARYPSMPLAIPPTAVDHIANLEDVGPLIVDIVRGVGLEQVAEPQQDVFRGVLARVSRRANIDFRNYKKTTLIRRIARRMTLTHNSTLEKYAELLDGNPDELNALVDALLIKVTEFFRDEEAFDYLRADILPAIIRQAAGRDHSLRVWSAGCATGEEPYSLAILLADLVRPRVPLEPRVPSEWKIKIFATDADDHAIQFARRAVYPVNVLKRVPEPVLRQHFERTDLGYQVSKQLRQMVIFGHQDLSRGVPFPRMDLVVCRNLLIYFTPELQQEIMNLFAYSLNQVSGYLFLGKAETVRPSRANYELVNKKWKVYRCTSGPLPATRPAVSSGAAGVPVRRIARRGDEKPPPAERAHADLTELRRFNEFVLRFLPTGLAIIDRSYRIVTINGAARRFLGFHDLTADNDFLHAVRGLPYAPLRNAIDTAFRERAPVTLDELQLDPAVLGEVRYVTLNLAVMQLEADRGELCVISIIDATDTVVNRHRVEASQAEQKQLLDELSAANKRLSDLNKDLEDANEELQAANEEMMLTQEELQATNEEFEATNEELQATNEELETNNEELQATNEELETTNEELSARTSELQRVMDTLKAERLRLSEIVELAPFQIMTLTCPLLVVERLNAKLAAKLPRGTEGRSVDEVFGDLGLKRLIEASREAYRTNTVQTSVVVEAQLAAGPEPWVCTVVPTHDGERRVTGLVIFADSVPRG